MKLAIKMASNCKKDIPVAAIIVYKNKILSKSINLNNKKNDPIAHAEILAIQQASKILKTKILNECDIYVTLEPCTMCAQAISFSRIRRLYFAAYNKKYGSIENGPRIFQYCHHIPETYGGIMEEESIIILKRFFKKIRKNKL